MPATLQEYTYNLLPASDPYVVIFLILTFLVAGFVKGFLGIGLPAAAMALMTLVMEPKAAISLLFIPIFFTNIAQYSRAKEPIKIAKKYKYFALAMMISIFFTATFIESYPTSFLTISIGVAMTIFSIQSLFNIKIPVKENVLWHVSFGTLSGVLGGLSTIWSPFIAMYLVARDYSREDFIGISGFLFLAGSIPLGLGLYVAGVVNLNSSLQSIIGLVAVMFGFRMGEIIRKKVSPNLFRRILLFAFLLMGLRLILINVF